MPYLYDVGFGDGISLFPVALPLSVSDQPMMRCRQA